MHILMSAKVSNFYISAGSYLGVLDVSQSRQKGIGVEELADFAAGMRDAQLVAEHSGAFR